MLGGKLGVKRGDNVKDKKLGKELGSTRIE